MKQFKFLSLISMAAFSFFISSCNSNENKTNDTTATTDTATAKQTNTVAAPRYTLIVRHKVADFAKWKAAYEGHDSTRVAYGLHNYLIARGTKDSNLVMVALRADDTAKANQFGALPSLRAAMQKGGVIGKPTIYFMDVQMIDSSTDGVNTRVMVTHKVKDWDTWKKTFDSTKQSRMDAGLTDRVVAYGVGDKNMVTVVFAISDMAKAEAFMNSKDLKDKMMQAGVVSQPDIYFYNVVQRY